MGRGSAAGHHVSSLPLRCGLSMWLPPRSFKSPIPPETWNYHIPRSYEIYWNVPIYPADETPLSIRSHLSSSIHGSVSQQMGEAAALHLWKLPRTFGIPRAVCIYAVEPYGEGLYLAMKEQADLETRNMRSLTGPVFWGHRYCPLHHVTSVFFISRSYTSISLPKKCVGPVITTFQLADLTLPTKDGPARSFQTEMFQNATLW